MTNGGVAGDAALRSLEFPEVREEIAKRSTCDVGTAAVRQLVPQLGDREWAERQLALVDDVIGFFLAGGALDLAGAVALSPLIDQAVKGASLPSLRLRSLCDTEVTLRSAAAEVLEANRPQGPLHGLVAQRRRTDDLINAIERAIDEEGRVNDGASSRLAAIRRNHRELSEQVRERCRSIVASAEFGKLLSEPIVTLRSGRYVVPVRSEFAPQFPGVVLDQSASGATVFMEPLASVEANNRLRTLEADEAREIARILTDLTGVVAHHETELRTNTDLVGQLDCAGARARWAITMDAKAPALSPEPVIRIVRGRHPLLRREPVPLDFEIGEAHDAVVVSGPNMGGKTVVLKTVGLLCLLAYAGIPIPASATTTIGVFRQIACIIGDEQSIAQDLSSFSAHLRALKSATSAAGPRSLVLVDEIGSGTEPAAGAALAQACIEAWIRAGARVVVTTHFTQLKTFAASHDRVRNASMLFDERTHAPTYVFAPGVPGQSLAFALASALDLDPRIISRAETLVGIDIQNLERTFERLAAERESLRQMQADLKEQQNRAARLEQTMRQRVTALEQEKEAFERRASAELSKAVETVRQHVLEQAQRRSETAARQAAKPIAETDQALQQTLQEMRRSLGLEENPNGATPSRAFSPGDEVFVKSFNATGTISEVYDRDVLVTIGNLKTLVAARDVVKRSSAATRTTSTTRRNVARPASLSAEVRTASLDASTSVDVRGMRVDEAWPLVDKALDDAMLASLHEIRIVHGKGTGRLAQGLREFLKGHPQVASTASAPDREGGSGVTIVKLV